MSEKANKRSGMLGTIYNMLPGIDDDYAAKLVYTLENKKSLSQLQQDIANISAQLSSDSPMTDTTVAKILLLRPGSARAGHHPPADGVRLFRFPQIL